MRKFLALILALLLVVGTFAACDSSTPENDQPKNEQTENKTESPEANKGEKGDQGEKGEDGKDGKDGKDGENGRSIQKTEIVDGCLWVTYSDDLENPVNLGVVVTGIVDAYGLDFYPLPDGTYGVMSGRSKFVEKIEIPPTYNGKAVTQILPSAFSGATNLTKITIPDSVTSISPSAFHCDSLTSITVDANNSTYKSIDGNLYSKDGKTLIQYAIGKTDTSVAIPNGVTSIGSSAFYDCSSLTSVTIPDSVTSIGSSAFSGCKIAKATIPASAISAIPQNNLKEVVITSGIIGDYAFDYCSSLTSVTIGSGVTSIGSSAFSDCDSLTSITVDANNSTYKSIDGNLYSKDGKTLIQYAIGKTDTSFAIPDGVTSIGSSAFYDCNSLTSITIPNSVTSIGDYAFSDCSSLTSVTIGSGVTSIGSYAFYSCYSLTSIKYRGTEEQWGNVSKYYAGIPSFCVITYNYTGE